MTDVRVLGPVEVSTDRGRVALRPREAAVVAALALGERPLSAGDIVHLLWDEPPATAVEALRNHVSRLRRSVTPLVGVGGGYRLDACVRVDARRLESVAAAASAGELPGSPAAQVATLEVARDTWRGDPFAELVARPRVIAARNRLDDLRASIDEEWVAAMLDAQQTARAHALLEQMVRDAPRRSRRWSLLALACYRLGLRDAALAASTRARDFRTDTGAIDDDVQLARMLCDDPILLTVPARPPARRAVPIIGRPLDPRLRRFGFVGRAAELERLRTTIDAGTANDGPSLVVVAGEPGIGKSALAYRAVTAASGRGTLVLWSWCEATPIGPFTVLGRLVHELVASLGADAVRGLAGSDLDALADLAPDVVWDAEHPCADGATGVAAGEAAVRLLVAAARTRPLVCVVDDVHWAPSSTVRLLADLVASDAPLVVLAIARREQVPTELAGASGPTVLLGELSSADVGEYLEGALEFVPAPELVELIWSRAGGHPLLLREVVGSIDPAASPEAVMDLASGTELPRSVADAVARRLDELSPAALRAVQAASVLGTTFSPPVLADMVDLDDDALAEATAAGIVTPEARRGRVRFCHELVRAAIYDGLSGRTRAELHEAAGSSLTARGVPRWNEVAHHFVAAAELDPRRAASASRRAGREALASFAFDAAAEHHRREADLLEQIGEVDTPALVDALVDWGYAMLRCGDPDMVAVLTRAASIARGLGDADRLARAVTVLCDMSLTSEAGAPDRALVELLDLALEVAEDPDTVARLAASASNLYSMSGDWQRCRSLYDRAVSTGAGSRAMAEVLPFAAIALGGPDDLGRRAAAADELDLIGERDHNPLARAEALHVRIGVQLQLGNPRFRETLDRMIEMESIVSEPGSRWSICYLTATREHIDGDLAAAEAAAAEGLGPRCRGIAESRLFAAYGAQLVALRADEDRLAELVPFLEELVTHQPDVASWRAVLIGARAEGGDHDRAGREFDVVAEDGFAALPRDFSWTAAMTMLTRGIAAAGDAGRARVAYDALVPYAGRMSWSGSCTFGPVDQPLGEAAAAFGDDSRARTHFSRAAEVAERLGAPRMLARAAGLFARAAGSLEPRLPGRDGDGIVD